MLRWRKWHFSPRQHSFQNESSFTDRMTEGGRWQMNRLQNSIVQFLKYVIELENLIILLNIGSLSCLRVSFIADRSLVLIFAMQEREWRPCTTGSIES